MHYILMTRTKIGDRVRVNFYFDSQVFEAMQIIARIKNTTYSELIRTACREYVVREAAAAASSAQMIKDLKVPMGTE